MMDESIRSAIDRAVEAGADLADVAQGVLAGIPGDGPARGEAAQRAFEGAARTILEHTKRIGGDAAAASRGILQAALLQAKGLDRRAA